MELDEIFRRYEIVEKNRKRRQNATSATRNLITFCKFLKYMRINYPIEYWMIASDFTLYSHSLDLDNIVHLDGKDYYKFHTEWDGTKDIVSVEKINNVKL